ncbi:MAG: glycosyltransferase family 4 protein [Litorilinea sp.]
MTEKVRILFVGFANVVHTQEWMDLLAGQDEFDVRLYAFPVPFESAFNSLAWQFPTYSLHQPRDDKPAKVHWLVPRHKLFGYPLRFLYKRYNLNLHWLRRIVRRWRPHIIHSLAFDFGTPMVGKALEGLDPAQRPRWVISTWGTDINWGVHLPPKRQMLETYLQACDGYFGDCLRDIRLARECGLDAGKVAFEAAMPATGGLDLGRITAGEMDPAARRNILVPKAYDNMYNKTLPLLEALKMCEPLLADYTIHMLRVSSDVKVAVQLLPASLRRKIVMHDMLAHDEVLAMMRSSRIVMAPSLTDGTPLAMLEAMASGALPIMSPIESIQEWIEDGKNGLLAHALYPNLQAEALTRALQDDDLVRSAAIQNRKLVEQRANRAHIKPQVLDYYRRLGKQGQNG